MTQKLCRQCSQPFAPPRCNAVFCSPACRQAAFRSRHGVTPAVTPATSFLAAIDRLLISVRAMQYRAIQSRHRRNRQWREFLREFISRAERKRSAAAVVVEMESA